MGHCGPIFYSRSWPSVVNQHRRSQGIPGLRPLADAHARTCQIVEYIVIGPPTRRERRRLELAKDTAVNHRPATSQQDRAANEARREALPPHVFNHQELFTRLGDDLELVTELIELFLESAPKLLGDVQRAVERRDSKAVERAAHRLRSSAGNFGRSEAVKAALRLEVLGRKGELADIDSAFQTLHDEFGRLGKALAEWVPSNVPARAVLPRVAIPTGLR